MPSSAWRSDVCSSDRSEEHTSELQSQSNLVCRIIRSEENTSELQSQSNLVCRIIDRKSTRLNSSQSQMSYDVFCLKTNIRVTPDEMKSTTHTSFHAHC